VGLAGFMVPKNAPQLFADCKVYRKESKTLSLGGKFSSSAGSFRTAAARSFSVAVQFAIGFNPQWLG
jgi:hypothetical protein